MKLCLLSPLCAELCRVRSKTTEQHIAWLTVHYISGDIPNDAHEKITYFLFAVSLEPFVFTLPYCLLALRWNTGFSTHLMDLRIASFEFSPPALRAQHTSSHCHHSNVLDPLHNLWRTQMVLSEQFEAYRWSGRQPFELNTETAFRLKPIATKRYIVLLKSHGQERVTCITKSS